MKKDIKNGFTLIELLAVIVILAILVAAAIPSVSSYLETSRKKSFVYDAQVMVDSVIKSKALSSQFNSGEDYYYSLEEINKIMSNKLLKSSFGNDYDLTSYVKVSIDNNSKSVYSVCLNDGFNKLCVDDETLISDVSVSDVVLSEDSIDSCSDYLAYLTNFNKVSIDDISKDISISLETYKTSISLNGGGTAYVRYADSVGSLDSLTDEYVNSNPKFGNLTAVTYQNPGTLTAGDHFTDGVYNYYYKHGGASGSFPNGSNLHWTVMLTGGYSLGLDILPYTVINGELVDSFFHTFDSYSGSYIDVSNIDVANVVSFEGAFAGVRNIDSLDLSNWDVSNGEMFNLMFSALNVNVLNLNGWDFSNIYMPSSQFYTTNFFASAVVDTLYMNNCYFDNNFNTDGSNFETYFMFNASMKHINIDNWDFENGVYSLYGMFWANSALETVSMKNWDLSNVVSVKQMFLSCNNLVSVDFSGGEFTNLKDIYGMFMVCDSLVDADLTSLHFTNFSDNLIVPSVPVFASATSLGSIKVRPEDLTYVNAHQEYFNPGMPSIFVTE